MVYRGKPSQACELCRLRRLKCDLQRPSCSQCLRVRGKCTGYRDLTALRIYDHSEEVVLKSRNKAASKDQRPILFPITSMPLSLDEYVTKHTFSYYVGTEGSRGIIAYLPNLLHSDPSPALQASIKAVGLVSLAKIKKSPRLLQMAYQQYGSALLATNEALLDKTMYTSDATLMAVVALSMYESVTSDKINSMGSRWLTHVNGAMKVLELRGTNQLQTRIGMELFSVIRAQITTNNMFCKRKTPPIMKELTARAMSLGNSKSQIVERLFEILMAIGDLSAEINDALFENTLTERLNIFIERALQLDGYLSSWCDSIDPEWTYETINVTSADTITPDFGADRSVYGQDYHVYPTVGIASIWNQCRQGRIVVLKIVQYLLARSSDEKGLPGRNRLHYQCATTCQQMAEDVFASVPYHFQSGEVGIGGSFRLLWPLYIASEYGGLGARGIEWTSKTFRKIEHATGNQQAFTMYQYVAGGHSLDMIAGSHGMRER